MLLLNRHAQSLAIPDELWTAVLEAGLEQGWKPDGWRDPLNFEGDSLPSSPQVPGEDAHKLAAALLTFPQQELAARLGLPPEEFARLITFLQHGSLLVCSDLLALSRGGLMGAQ